mgnify:CR=1|jgi:hypothetical protein
MLLTIFLIIYIAILHLNYKEQNNEIIKRKTDFANIRKC